ncbi:hypothetical protein NUW54_g12505 [Trametes sanguinea]|uniref:Uncharacterized protein n=1 Tax=Trametes sanguinea TaxID=158606 RepID=A0ACC1MX85_9APHY|nr:hypothetical protein NUW54_g12505 [Trametes sanguinea]
MAASRGDFEDMSIKRETQHAPSKRAQAEEKAQVVDARTRQSLREQVRRHVFGATMLENDLLVVHGFTDEVEVDVDMLRAWVEGVVLGERDGGAVVRKESERVSRDVGVDDVAEKVAQPERFLGRVRECDVLGFGA